jgi:hypothetical protein
VRLDVEEPIAASSEATNEPEAVWDVEEPAERTDAWPIVGYTVGGLSLASYVTGYVLYAKSLAAQQTYADSLNALADPKMVTTELLTGLRDADDADGPPLIAAAVGGVRGTASLPMWLPESRSVPWWGWTIGGAGFALGVAGTALSVDEAKCDVDRFDRCTEPTQATHLGGMLVLQAFPLLAVPVVQGIRSLTGKRLDLSVSGFGGHGAFVEIEGTL